VLLPFPADRLPAIPAGFVVDAFDIEEPWPAAAAAAEFYVPDYLRWRKGASVIADMPRLRYVQTLTAGYEHLDGFVPDRVTLCNAAGVHDAVTSELAVGLMIAAQRRLPALVTAQAEHRWDQQMSMSLADKRVLVIGAGHVGQATRRRLDGFECEVQMVGRVARDGVHGVDELPALLPEVDIVVLIVPLTDETRGLVDRAFLARMRDGALLVNVARGPVVVTDDLLAELSRGRLRAALDVTDPEPLPADHPLWSAPGALVTPHVGGAAQSMWPRAYALVSDQLQRLADGRPLRNVVRPARSG
jgi:phosphoglycerate dehydrogenase-like enzyme